MAIIFIIMVFLAWYLYIRGEKVYTLLIFFFFATFGFQLVPEKFMMLTKGFSKGTDYALVLLIGCLTIDFICHKAYFKMDTFVKCLSLFFLFLIACVIYSKVQVGCSTFEIIKASRAYLLFGVYFVFRQMSRDELVKLLHLLFYLTLFTSCIYVLQILTSTGFLNDATASTMKFGRIEVKRFYNQPYMLFLMTFIAIYKNPLKGYFRLFSIFIFVLAIVGGFSRSATVLFLATLALGYVLSLTKTKRLAILIIATSILIPVVAVGAHLFIKSRTYKDIQAVMLGNFVETDFDLEDLYESTFAFRIGHFAERAVYMSEDPLMTTMGLGLIPEESPKAEQFGFILGLMNEDTGATVQLETPDISYSVLLVRFGYLGMALFVLLYFYAAYFFYKRRENRYALVSFQVTVLALGVSFFSSNLVFPVTYILMMLCINLVRKDIEETAIEC